MSYSIRISAGEKRGVIATKTIHNRNFYLYRWRDLTTKQPADTTHIFLSISNYVRESIYHSSQESHVRPS